MTTATGVRLPTGVRPVHYDLTLTPDLKEFQFQGEEAIRLAVTAPVDTITLHAIDLKVISASVALSGGRSFPTRSIQMNEQRETVTFTFGSQLPIGEVTLRIRFSGTLNDQLRGFYRSRYTGPDGEPRVLATTQFEATDARRAFPCWDEPGIKSTFRVTLNIPPDLTAISNMPIESERTTPAGLKAVRFETSPKMSTYLLAFIVGDMSSIETTAKGGTLVRVWTTRGKEGQAQFALDNAVRVLDYLNDYFGIPYPLPKLDHIAIPDFAAGAMENWGAVTYRETALLYDPQNSAAATQQRILEVVAHETAHMWFGDLVTMEWWDALWLNESFATWMATKCVDRLMPSWQMWTQFISNQTNGGLGLDGLRNSHPIEVPVEDPAQIREIFDAISYNKGGAVLRMLEDYVGEDNFRNGLRGYLTAHEYDNARTEDLWNALGEASGLPVPDVMRTWVLQTGYPYLEVDTAPQGDGLALHISQRRFLYDLLINQQDDPTMWKAPISVMRQGAPDKTSFVLEGREEVRQLGPGSPGGWAKANWGQTGFYRVHYAGEGWERLREGVRRAELPAPDRLGLQNDAYALARAGLAPATQFLALAEAYANEDDATVWGDLAANIGGMATLIANESFLAAFDAFGRRLFQNIARTVGWDAAQGEGHLEALRRSIVLGAAGSYGDPEVLAEAKARFARYLQDRAAVSPNIRLAVLALTAQQGSKAEYDALWEIARTEPLQEEKLRMMRGLANFPQPELVQSTLEKSLSADVRSQDTILVVGAVASNRANGRALAWDFLRANWAEFDRRYGRGGAAITNLVAITGGFTTAERAAEVESFFKANPVPSAARTIEQSLERIRLNVAWLERNRAGLAEWLAARS